MRVDCPRLTLEVEVAGLGPPAVLLLHGWPDSHELWRHQVAALNGAGSHDRPGPAGLRRLGQAGRVDAYGLRTSSATCSPCSIPGRRAGPRGRPRLGRRHVACIAAFAARPRRPPRRCLSVGHPPPSPPPAFPAGEVLVHAAVPVRRRRREVAVGDDWANFRDVGRAIPTSTGVERLRPGGADGQPGHLVPGHCAAGGPAAPAWPCRRSAPDHGRVVVAATGAPEAAMTGSAAPSPARGATSARGRRPLDAARGARPGERPAARLPDPDGGARVGANHGRRPAAAG